MSDLIHGIEVKELTEGVRPITTARASVIGMVGTAPESAMELNKPYLVTNARQARQLIFDDPEGQGADGGTLLAGLDGVYAHANAVIVLVRVEEGEDDAETAANAAGSASARTGAYALLNAESVTGVAPRILCAPGISQFTVGPVATTGVPAALLAVATRLRAIALIEGPSTNLADATAAEALVSGARNRAYFVDPAITTTGNTVKPNSGYVAGVIVQSDNDRGWWWSPSNRPIAGITGTARPIDYAFGDPACEADVLNGLHINTIIRLDGFRLWGNRTLDKTDPSFKFISVRRIADQLQESLLRSHLWAVDQNITRNYVESVVEGVNSYLRYLTAQGAILGGRCYPNPDLNTPEVIASGRVYFDFDYTPVTPAEKVIFRAHLVNDYVQEIFA